MLISTKIGGLGLNISSANVVIMFEHDWNPMADLQAMDRAHRLGQNRIVTVHRMIMAETIEEHILNLQQFKKHIISTVINEDNEEDQQKMKSSDKDRIIDNIIQNSSNSLPNAAKKSKISQDGQSKGFSQAELWDEDEYDL